MAGNSDGAIQEPTDKSPDLWDNGYGDAAGRQSAGVRWFDTNGCHSTKTR
ncbi:MAG TPA: hypothetical protein VG674_27630 [Amycolatopsis sp.]|nr:hypothetical protein [Amycolatopsis sp.]